MSSSSPTSATIVIDASVAIWAILPVMSTVDVISHFVTWRQANCEIHVPSLWLAECTSVIRRAVHSNIIQSKEGLIALEDLFALDAVVTPTTAQHCRMAYAWAERLAQAKAYDSFYLALAEELGATFFTADKRLANSAQQLGVGWVYWIGN